MRSTLRYLFLALTLLLPAAGVWAKDGVPAVASGVNVFQIFMFRVGPGRSNFRSMGRARPEFAGSVIGRHRHC
jgi:hypothetical protein